MKQETKDNLLARIAELESQLEEALQHLQAIKSGEVSAFILNKNNRPEIFTLESVDYTYRVLVENFSEGALNLSEEGMIIYTNKYFHELLEVPIDRVISKSIFDFIHPDSFTTFKEIFKKGLAGQAKGEINLLVDDKIFPVYISLTSLYPTLPSVGMVVSDLKERKIHEQTLAENKILEVSKKAVEDSEKRYNMMLMQSPFAFAIFSGKDLVITLANDRMKEVLGKGKNIENRPLLEVLPELVGQPFPGYLQKVLETGIPFSANDALAKLKRNGKLVDAYFNFVYQPYWEVDGSISGITCIAYEVTNEVIAKKKIEESRTYYQTLTDNTPVMAWITDHDGHCTYLNKQWYDFTGQTPETGLGSGWTSAIHPDDANHSEEIFLNANEKHIPFSNTYRIRNIRGEYFWHLIKGLPKFDKEGNFEGFIGSVIDIHESVLVNKKIEENEQKLQAAVSAIEGVVWTSNARGEMEGVQQGWASLTGQNYFEYQGIGWTSAIHPEDVKPTIDAWNNAVRSQSIFIFEHRVKVKDTWRHFSIRAIPLKNPDGTIREWVGVHMDITDKKRSENIIKESEEKFRTMAESSDILIGVNNETVDAVYFNKTWEKLTGRSVNDLLKLGWADLLHPDDKEPFLNKFFTAYRNKESYDGEFRILNRDGNYSWLYAKVQVRLHPDGSYAGHISSSIDITERKKNETALKDSEAFNRTVLESSPDCVNVIDASGRLQFMNINGMRIMEIDDFNLFKNKQWSELWGEANRHLALHAINAGMSGRTQQFQAFCPTTKGTPKWWDVMISPVQQHGSKNVTSLISVSRDITQQMESLKKIENSERELKQITETIPQMVWVCNSKGEVIYFNQQWYIYTGTVEEEMMGHQWVSLVHPEDVESALEKWNYAQKTLTPVSVEYRLKSSFGDYRWVLSKGVPILDAHGKLQKWFGACTFIDEQKEFTKMLEQKVEARTVELNEKNKVLEKMNRELQSFAYISSHDLQEPLRKIQTFSTQIIEKENLNLSASGKEKLFRMQLAANRMQTLINDLLAYSRTSTEERKFETVHLSKIIEDVKEDLREELEEKKAVIEATELCYVNIVPFQFRQLMYNLISNSLKFANPSKPPRIIIKSKISNEFNSENNNDRGRICHISVSDNGIGFEQLYSEKIFEVFQRLHAKNEYDGTGIGLAIVKKIIENHKGKITAHSELGKGARFDIYLPA